MKDFFGTEIKVGDTVAFMQTGYRSLMSGTVIKLTEKTVFIKHAKTNVCSEETKQSPRQVIVKTNKPEKKETDRKEGETWEQYMSREGWKHMGSASDNC